MGTESVSSSSSPPPVAPLWFQHLVQEAQAGCRVFLLHFNVRDFAFSRENSLSSSSELRDIRDFLLFTLANAKNVALYYSLSSGIRVCHLTTDVNVGELGLSLERAVDIKSYTPQVLEDKDLTWRFMAEDAERTPYSLTDAVQRGDTPIEHSIAPQLAFPLLTRALTSLPYTVRGSATAVASQEPSLPSQPLSIGLVIDFLEHLVPSQSATRHEITPLIEMIHRWSLHPRLKEREHIVVLLTSELGAVHPELHGRDSRIVTIEVERPNVEQRQAFLEWLGREKPGLKGRTTELANRTAGMNYSELLDFTCAMEREGWESCEELLKHRRSQIISRESNRMLVPMDDEYGLDRVAGYGYVKEQIEPILSKLRNGKADVSGILLVGPPGTGKTFLAKALARHAGVNVVRMCNVRSMWVGGSERNLEQVLEVASALHPVVIFVDEIDQQFPGRRMTSGDSGVEQRIFGRLLEFMDDKNNLGKVLWVAASNRPDLLDAALLSRFKLRCPFLLPDLDTCREMINTSLPYQAKFEWDEVIADEAFNDLVGKYSGRELEIVVRDALWRAEKNNALSRHDGVGRVPTRFFHEAKGLARVGHDHNMYVYQSLLALRSIPFNSPGLTRAIRTSLPSLADRILDGEVVDEDGLATQILEYSRKVRDLPWW